MSCLIAYFKPLPIFGDFNVSTNVIDTAHKDDAPHINTRKWGVTFALISNLASAAERTIRSWIESGSMSAQALRPGAANTGNNARKT